MNEEENQVKRSKVIRVICGVLWFIPIYLVVQVTVGAVVGAMAGVGTGTYQAGYVAGHAASTAFFQKYGLVFLVGELGLTIWLGVVGILPGTGKWKRA